LCEDPYFHEVLYTTLIDLCDFTSLSELDNPLLEKHLRSNGGMPPSGILDGPIGPLELNQVSNQCRFPPDELPLGWQIITCNTAYRAGWSCGRTPTAGPCGSYMRRCPVF